MWTPALSGERDEEADNGGLRALMGSRASHSPGPPSVNFAAKLVPMVLPIFGDANWQLADHHLGEATGA